jgi:hypothetical protein
VLFYWQAKEAFYIPYIEWIQNKMNKNKELQHYSTATSQHNPTKALSASLLFKYFIPSPPPPAPI